MQGVFARDVKRLEPLPAPEIQRGEGIPGSQSSPVGSHSLEPLKVRFIHRGSMNRIVPANFIILIGVAGYED